MCLSPKVLISKNPNSSIKVFNKLIIKSLYNKKIFKINYNEIVIFQKLTNEQLIILLAIEQL